MTYRITNDSIIVSRSSMFLTIDSIIRKDTILYKAKVDYNTIDNIDSLQLTNLRNDYYNKCILITSGNEYFVSIKTKKGVKSIHLHHYYLKQVEDLIAEINKLLPEKYAVRYLSEATEQNCN
ncbi:hypothetical protein DNU06_17070 [Putridiphycobacter roseus]|uniref:Uncharacterized protein n=2 Tax=Putridiphycobacter roseus TaxID=2219161 RepID=A0A2W1N9B0_9FLAO|nr:hypothetical protein DNU06_17070 [Putridiphycobacter roseus]